MGVTVGFSTGAVASRLVVWLAGPLKGFAIRTFGQRDKTALVVGIVVVALARQPGVENIEAGTALADPHDVAVGSRIALATACHEVAAATDVEPDADHRPAPFTAAGSPVPSPDVA